MSPVENCHDARALLMAYLDSELDAATTVSVREHLLHCTFCAERFEQEERLEGALGKMLRVGAMPVDVDQRLDVVLETASKEKASRDESGRRDGSSGETPLAQLEGGTRRGGAGRRRPASTWRWIAAAALALVALTLALLDEGVRRDEAPAYVGEFVSAWESAVQLQHRADFSGSSAESLFAAFPAQDPQAIRVLLDEMALSGFEFPEDGRVHDHAVHLVGARVESFDGVRAVNVLYDCCGVLTSVFVLPKRALDALPEGHEALLGPVDLEVEGVNTYTVVRDDLLISVVSRHASGLADQWSS